MFIANLLKKFIRMLALITVIMTVIRLLPLDLIVVDWVSHFVFQLALLSATCFILLLVAKEYVSAIVLLVVAFFNAYLLYPLYGESQVSFSAKHYKPVKIMQANLLRNNQQTEKFFAQVAAHTPDIIVIQEVSSHWSRLLKPLTENYPYGMAVTREDNFGIAIYSRLELSVKRIDVGQAKLPSLHAQLDIPGKTVDIVATHPLPPFSKESFLLRNEQVQQLSHYINTSRHLKVVVGDFNNTPWTRYYQNFLAQSDLKSVRDGHGIVSTWPAMAGPVGIPIDHIFVSRGIGVSEVYSGANIGSDHLPLISTIHIPLYE